MKTGLKILAAILCVIMVFPTLGAGISEAAASYVSFDYDTAQSVASVSVNTYTVKHGDANGDGSITIKDALVLKKHLASVAVEIDLAGADANSDGVVNVSDVNRLKQFLACSANPITETLPCASVQFDTESESAKITAMKASPSLTFSLSSSVSAAKYKYVVISYRHPANSSVSLGMSLPNGAGSTFALTNSSESTQKAVDLSNDALWTGSVSSVSFTTDLAKNDVLYIEYIAFAENADAAARVIAVHNGEIVDDPMKELIFDNAETTALITAAKNTDVSYNSSQNAAKLTVSGSNSDPQTVIDYEDSTLSADDYKYITITYMVPSNTSSSANKSELFLCAGSVTAPVADCNATFNPVKDGVYHYAVISLAEASFWTGDIHLIRLDYFSQCAVGDTMYVDSICLSETRADATAIGYERLALRGAAGGVYTADTQLNGQPATINYYDASSMSNGTCTFSGHTTLLINGDHSSFNRFCFDYSTNTIIRGVAYYTSGGVERADEFFLENTSGQTATFRSLILDYFSGAYAAELRSIDLYTITTSSASVRISGVTEEDYTQYAQTTHYITGTNFKLGVDLLMGGGVNYFEDFNDNNSNYGNLLNNYDVGRLVQQSYYGIDKAPYELGWWGGHSWQYNPVQGGDKDNNISRVVDFEYRGANEIYVKARPMDWGQSNRITPSYMENVYTVTDTYVKIYNRFIDFSGYTHVDVRQELPAFYTISALKDFYFYNGSSPWTGGALTKKENLPFWGTYPEQTTFTPSNPEYWSAWCDGTGYGIGLYVPGVAKLRAGRHQYNGSASPTADATNYVSPQRNMTLICGKPIVYSYLITAGNLTTIRNVFRDNRNIISNSALVNYNR